MGTRGSPPAGHLVRSRRQRRTGYRSSVRSASPCPPRGGRSTSRPLRCGPRLLYRHRLEVEALEPVVHVRAAFGMPASASRSPGPTRSPSRRCPGGGSPALVPACPDPSTRCTALPRPRRSPATSPTPTARRLPAPCFGPCRTPCGPLVCRGASGGARRGPVPRRPTGADPVQSYEHEHPVRPGRLKRLRLESRRAAHGWESKNSLIVFEAHDGTVGIGGAEVEFRVRVGEAQLDQHAKGMFVDPGGQNLVHPPHDLTFLRDIARPVSRACRWTARNRDRPDGCAEPVASNPPLLPRTGILAASDGTPIPSAVLPAIRGDRSQWSSCTASAA